MTACMAPPWPSQRRAGAGGGMSERHSALARMRDRRLHREAEDCRNQAKPPLSARTPRYQADEERESPRRERPQRSSDFRESPEAGAKPWSPAWTPDSPHRHVDDPPQAAATAGDRFCSNSEQRRQVETPRGEQRHSRHDADIPHRQDFGSTFSVSSSSSSNRVRGPAEARAARAESRPKTSGGLVDDAGDDELPRNVKGADFRTLQEMIAGGIAEAESKASNMEGPLQAVDDNDEDLRRHREAFQRRKEEALQAKQKEREQARARRQKQWEEQQKRMQAELDREMQQEQEQREELKAVEKQCRKEMAAASRVQATFRGRRSRKGKTYTSPFVRPVLHSKPWRD
eukprot:TRINITY_DN48976_c0_g1_i1.p1 TRINITY_DN48976_c0_g1~~TRINITY_DN48976_c0_g1_i1.p1  ORF type:complete len:344 (+),score=79.54 TRINITY_DN48976_c0_g1_i1:91-1122(+)